jgi:hypothetical protein
LKKPITRRRRKKGRLAIDSFAERAYAPYALAIGQFVLAWNALHEKLGLLFVMLLHSAPGWQTDRHYEVDSEEFPDDSANIQRWSGVWSSSALDRPKRAMLRALINPFIIADLRHRPQFAADLTWILDEADKLEEIRNNAVHTPLVWVGKHPAFGEYLLAQHNIDVIPNLILSNKRAITVTKRDLRNRLVDDYRWAREATVVLCDFVGRIGNAMNIEGATWPHRPSLPNRGQKRKRRNRRPPAQPK